MTEDEIERRYQFNHYVNKSSYLHKLFNALEEDEGVMLQECFEDFAKQESERVVRKKWDEACEAQRDKIIESYPDSFIMRIVKNAPKPEYR